jgi:hypothetical protein
MVVVTPRQRSKTTAILKDRYRGGRNIPIELIDPIPPSLQPETVTADFTDTQLTGSFPPFWGLSQR